MKKPKQIRIKKVDSLTDLKSHAPVLGFEVLKFDGLTLSTNIGVFMLSDEHLFLNKEPILVSEIPNKVELYKQSLPKAKKNGKRSNMGNSR